MNITGPTNFNEFIINKRIVNILRNFTIHNLTNILLYGHKNTGKKTIIYNFIKHLFNKTSITTQHKVDELKYKHKQYSCSYKYSKYYYEIDLLENIKCSKYIINDFIQNICNNKCINNSYRIIIIHNLHVIDITLIKSLLNIIERNYHNNKFILICNSTQINLFYKLSSIFLTLRCYIDKNELELYIEDMVRKKYTLTKKNTPIIYSCNDLYYINMLLEFKSIPPYDPIQKYVEKIYTIIKKYNTILFLEKIRPLLYEMYLLDFNLALLIQQFIKYIKIKHKNIPDDTLHLLYHLSATYDPLQSHYFQPFTLVETFFINIKKLNICI